MTFFTKRRNSKIEIHVHFVQPNFVISKNVNQSQIYTSYTQIVSTSVKLMFISNFDKTNKLLVPVLNLVLQSQRLARIAKLEIQATFMCISTFLLAGIQRCKIFPKVNHMHTCTYTDIIYTDIIIRDNMTKITDTNTQVCK